MKDKDEDEQEVFHSEMKVQAMSPAVSTKISRPQEKRMNKYPKQVSGGILGTHHEDKDKNVNVNELVVLVVNFTWNIPEVSSFKLICSNCAHEFLLRI